MTSALATADLDFDVVELAPYVPPASAAPLREVAFRSNAWLPGEVDRLRQMFAADAALPEICEALGRPLAGVTTKLWELGLRRRTSRPWSELEDAELVRRYGVEPAARIAQDFGRSVGSVYVRAQLLELTEEGAPNWDPWEDAQLRAGYAEGVPVMSIAAIIGRAISATSCRASYLGLKHPSSHPDWSDEEQARALELAVEGLQYNEICRRLAAEGFPPRTKAGLQPQLWRMGYRRGWGRPWTPEEDDLIRQAYAEGACLTPLRERLGRTRWMISHRSGYLGLQGTHARPSGWRTDPPWTAEEEAILRRDYARVKPKELAQQLGRSKASVYTRAWNLGLETGKYKSISAEEERAIRIAAARQFPIAIICRALDRDQVVIKKAARRFGVEFITNPKKTSVARRAAKALGAMTLQDILALDQPPAPKQDEATLGILLSAMSDTSAASLLECSTRWVAAQRAQLQERLAA